MSKIGKKAILFDINTTRVEKKFRTIKVIGLKGQLSMIIPLNIDVTISEGVISVFPCKKNSCLVDKEQWGMSRALLSNMVQGVTQGFSKQLKIYGIGYKVSIKQEKILVFSLGFCHDIGYIIPQGIEVKCAKNIINIFGIDKQQVGNVAAEIRSLKKPEPYKGKGIMYCEEKIIRKEGKKK